MPLVQAVKEYKVKEHSQGQAGEQLIRGNRRHDRPGGQSFGVDKRLGSTPHLNGTLTHSIVTPKEAMPTTM